MTDRPAWGHVRTEADAEPVLDVEVLERLERLGTATGEDLMGQLTVLFLADAELHVGTMRDALDVNDVAAVVRSAHTLTGASGNVGATRLARLFGAFATEDATRDRVVAVAQLDAIDAELDRVRAALGEWTLTP